MNENALQTVHFSPSFSHEGSSSTSPHETHPPNSLRILNNSTRQTNALPTQHISGAMLSYHGVENCPAHAHQPGESKE